MEDGIIDKERLKSYKKLKAENSYMEDAGKNMFAKKKKFKEYVGYGLKEEYRHQGYMTEVMQMITVI